MALEVEIEKKLPDFTLQVAFRTGNVAGANSGDNGKPVGILGASGAGKTLTLRSVAGLEKPDRGKIVLDGRVLFDSASSVNVPSRERGVGMLFQHYALFPHLTVEQNVAFGLRNTSPRERAGRVAAQLAAMHLSGFERRYPAALSGGEQQRVALARVLVTQPAALLLDEPFSALDTHLRSQLERQLPEMLAGYRGDTLLVSHDLEEIYRLCGNLVVMHRGLVVAQRPREEIFRHPPDKATAQLTGCKNFSAARRNGNTIDALDWNCALSVSQPLPRSLGHVAIRAHHIRMEPSANAPALPGENTFPCWLSSASEAPFRVTLYLRLNASASNPAATHHLQAEVTQEHWAALKAQPQPWSVHLDPDRLILLPD